MGINIDNSECSEYAVNIELFDIIREFWVEFSRTPDPEVIKELYELCQRPGFSMFDCFKEDLRYCITYPPGWNGAKIAEAVALCLETEHGLIVRREFNKLKPEIVQLEFFIPPQNQP